MAKDNVLPTWVDLQHFPDILAAAAIVVLVAMILERALSVPFEWALLRDWLIRKKLRAPIALVLSYSICATAKFDIIAITFRQPGGWSGELALGTFVTAALIAGGSKGAILLFQGSLGFGRDAVEARVQLAGRFRPPTTGSPSPSQSPGQGDRTTRPWYRS